MSPQSTDNLDLALTAQQYVAGELSLLEVTAFEELLANDEQAQAVLADVVLLTGATIQSERVLSRSVEKRKIVESITMTVMVLSILFALTTLLFPWYTGSSQSPLAEHEANTPSVDDVAVAELWVSMSEDFETVSSPVEEQPVTKSDSLYDVPDWLFAAVEANNAEMGDMDSLGMDPLNTDEEGTL